MPKRSSITDSPDLMSVGGCTNSFHQNFLFCVLPVLHFSRFVYGCEHVTYIQKLAHLKLLI